MQSRIDHTIQRISKWDFFSFGKSHPCPFGPRIHIYSITYLHQPCPYVDSEVISLLFLTETEVTSGRYIF